jgi:hypothetical protein
MKSRQEWFGLLLEMEPHTGSYQVLPQVTAAVGVDLRVGVVQVAIFDEGAPFWRPVIICSGYYLPGEIRMILPSAGAEWSTRRMHVEPGRFGIVNANSRARIRLKPSQRQTRPGSSP